MEKLNEEFLNKRYVEFEKKAQGDSTKEFRRLWVRVSYAVPRDLHMRRIGARAFGIFIVIRSYMNKEYIAYPSLGTIAYQARCSEGTARREIRELEKYGWLKKIGKRREQDGRFGSMQYQIVQTDLVRGTGNESFINMPAANIDDGK